MKEKQYKEKLRKEVKKVEVPNILNEIKEANYSFYATNDLDIIPQADFKDIKKKKNIIKYSASLVMALTLVFAFIIMRFTMNKFDNNVYAIANIEVSETTTYSIDINKGSKVVEITTNSKEGEEILNFTYKHKNIDNVLTNLLKSCVDYWDLTEEQLVNRITFFVDCHDNNTKSSLEHHWDNSMNEAKKHCSEKHNGGHH